MRKIFTTLKSVVAATVIAAMALATSCSYDDTAIKNDVEKIKTDLAALTERVAALENELDEQVAGLTELINGKVVVTDVKTEGDTITVTLSDGTSFVIDNSKSTGAVAGDDYTIGAYADGGVYYWAVFKNGAFDKFLEVDGQKVPVFAEGCDCEEQAPAEGCACDLKMEVREDGKLYVSIDGGANWVSTELPAAQVSGACVFTNVVVDGDKVTFTLADGTTFDVQKAELVEFEAAKSAVYVKVGETKAIPFAINDAVEDINVMNQPLGWKASVDVPTRAVGGMDYVLNITAPSKEFAQYADKSGKVAIHFNTAAGACKVMSIDVELASIDLQVDKEGNITITSTVVDEYDYTNWYGETEHIVEFNNFYLAIFDLDTYYGINGDLESVYNSSWGEFNIPAAAGWINNVVTNIGDNTYEEMTYVDGVNEEWTINATVEDVLKNLDWYGQLPYEGNSFMVCVIPTDVNANGAPVWAETIAVPFKQLSISIEENVDYRVFNNAYFNVTLRGGSAYYLCPASKADVDMYINEYGYYDSVQDYFWDMLAQYLAYPDWYSFGFKIASDVVEENIALSDLLAYTSDYYYFETKPATEYYMCLFIEEDGKTEYTIEDLKFYEFSTADITLAETAFEVTYEMDEDWSLYSIGVNVTVPETTATVYSRWYDETMPDDDMKADLIANGYAREQGDFEDGGYTYYLGTSVDAPATTKVLGLLVIDAQGNYTLKQFELKSKDIEMNETYVPTIESVTFDAEGAHITVGGLEGADVKAYKYYIISTTGDSYYQKTEEECFDVAYSNDWLYQSSEVNPILATRTADYKYSFAEGSTYKVAVGVEFADGSFSECVYGEYTYGSTAETFEIECVRAKYVSNKLQLYTSTADKDGLCLVLYCYNIVDTNKMYFPAGSYEFGSSYGTIYCYGYSYLYDYSVGAQIHKCDAGTGAVVVSEVDGKYRVEVECMFDEGTVPFQTVYEGAIENLILPSEFKEPEALAFEPVRAEYDNKMELFDYNGGDAEYAFWLYDAEGNYLEVTHKFGNHTNWDDVYAGKYVTVDGTVYEATKVTTQAPNTWNCGDGEKYFVANVVTADYVIDYSGQLPAVEVNYYGSGSTYAPGSENPGVGGEEEQVTTELTMVSHAFGYTGSMETEVIFTDVDGNQHIVDFRMTGITAGEYSGDNNGIILGYCRYMYGRSDYGGGVSFDSADATIVDNGDTTFTFDVTFVAERAKYHFTYTTPKEESTSDVTTVQLVSKSAGETMSYYKAWTFSDAEGNNSVKLIVDEYYSYDSAADFPKANEYTTFQSSYSYITSGSHFSFVNNTLVVNGVTYKNDDVTNVKLSVVQASSVTIEFTVDEKNYKFVYSI